MEPVFQAIIIVVIAAAAAGPGDNTRAGFWGEGGTGQAAGACAVQLVGVAAALYAALPLMRTFLTMIGECL